MRVRFCFRDLVFGFAFGIGLSIDVNLMRKCVVLVFAYSGFVCKCYSGWFLSLELG